MAEQVQTLRRHSWEEFWEELGVRRVLTAPKPPEPVRVEFQDQAATYCVLIHHAPQYHMLRHWHCGDDLNFVRSLFKCTGVKPSGGKSGVSFYLSHDRRFFLKEVKKAEFKWLCNDVESLFWYTDQVLFDKLPSVMAQVVGLFTVDVRKHHRTKSKVRHWIVQRNLRFALTSQSRAHVCFDLKGLGTSRRAPATAPAQADAGGPDDAQATLRTTTHLDPPNFSYGAANLSYGTANLSYGGYPALGAAFDRPKYARQAENQAEKAVLWDQNFREWRDGKPLCLLSQHLKYIEAALWNDAQFLSKECLIDYSLLLAADDEKGASPTEPRLLSVGIIDYLRPYTLDKRLETLWKSATVHTSVEKPTVIEPGDYRERFLTAMGTFFVAETAPPSSGCSRAASSAGGS